MRIRVSREGAAIPVVDGATLINRVYEVLFNYGVDNDNNSDVFTAGFNVLDSNQ
jgi:hypothetical protein